MATIEFTISPELWRVASPPYRAAKSIPQWWHELERGLPRDENNPFPAHTVKACSPIFDILTSGYIVPLPFDLHVSCDGNDNINFHWRFAPGEFITSHSPVQIPVYGGAWKLGNPWVIKTPPGYSILVSHPFHRPELPFHTLEAIVDTDTYHNQINFPFRWTGGEYEGVLRAGTPFAQIIPFKREPWSLNVHAMTDDERAKTAQIEQRVGAHQHEYRRRHHHPKTYRQEKADV